MPNFPGRNDRIMLLGMNGTGKTVAGLWHLSRMPIDEMPWIVLDMKGDENVANIEKSTIITYDEPLPKKPGIYVLRVRVGDEKEILETYLWRVYEQGGIGLFVDEALMVGQNNKAFNTILVQGRTLEIPCILCTQRPVDCSTYCRTEATYWQVFDLIRLRDRQTVAEDVPISHKYKLDKYHSYYFDVRNKELIKFKPVPDVEDTLAAIHDKLPNPRRTL